MENISHQIDLFEKKDDEFLAVDWHSLEYSKSIVAFSASLEQSNDPVMRDHNFQMSFFVSCLHNAVGSLDLEGKDVNNLTDGDAQNLRVTIDRAYILLGLIALKLKHCKFMNNNCELSECMKC